MALGPTIAALMAGLDGSWAAEGALAALGERQARERDDWRDAEPGRRRRHGRVVGDAAG